MVGAFQSADKIQQLRCLKESRFIPRYTELVEPLQALIRGHSKDMKSASKEEHERALSQIRTASQDSIALMHSTFMEPFFSYIDADRLH